MLKRSFIVLLIGLTGSCVDPYNPPKIKNNGFLVVNGIVNVLSGNAEIVLNRTVALTSSESPAPIEGAVVYIESEGGEKFSLEETAEGVYNAGEINLNSNLGYRLYVRVDGRQYASDYVPITSAPPIDSVTWDIVDNDAVIYVHSRNPEPGTRFYMWTFSETWLYNSFVPSHYVFENKEVLPRDRDIYYCWKTNPSSEILIESTIRLSEDVVEKFPLTRVTLGASKFRIRYSIEVLQHALTKDAYEYWQKLEENIRDTGGLFDAQPSRITGNIRSLTDNEEPVLGYFSIGAIQKKRIFINNQDLPKSTALESGYEECAVDTLLLADVANFAGDKLLGTAVRLVPSDMLIGYIISTPYCVDCTLAGGVNIKPEFWEE